MEHTSARLGGRRILVTGAASGIGRATARLFQAEGAQLILLDRNGPGLQDTLGDGAGVCCEVDITDEAAVEETVARTGRDLGGIDGVVNAAGIYLVGATIDVAARAWRRVIEVNLTGTYIVARSCLPWLMRAKGSTIVNIASAAGLLPNAPRLTAYAASKGGVVALTRSLAADLAPDVRVNCVCPGMVDTPMADGHRANVGTYALKRIADPMEIARAILFLTSSESSYVTGTAIAVDGGRSFH